MNKDVLLKACNRYDINMTHGKGVYIYDDKGREYLDFTSGIATNCLGHCNPAMVNAVKEQADKLFHASQLFYNEEQLKLGQKLVDNSDMKAVYFTNSGTESNECALKIVKKHGRRVSEKKTEVIYMANSFHGRSMGSLSATGQEKYREPYLPLIPNFVECRFNDIEDFLSKINENTCGVILEPLQGEGGLIDGDIEFLKTVRQKCDEFNALLIFDEIQCGMGRLGSLFAYPLYGVVPDIISCAKGLGGGIVIGACLTGPKAVDVMLPGEHGTTFGGNPFACHVSLAVVTELVDNGVIDNCVKVGNYLKAKLNELKDKYPVITNINGRGLLLGIKLDDTVTNGAVIAKCIEQGILLVPAGGNIIRTLPPLNVTEKEVDLAIEKIDAAFKTL